MMKTLVLLWIAAIGTLMADPASTGIITASKESPGDDKMTVEYNYTKNSHLTVVVHGIEMNAAARNAPKGLVGGELSVKGNVIRIAPKEIYDDKGAVESLRQYTVRYSIPKVAAGHYRFVHDDSAAEGMDRIIDLRLDLRKPVSKTLVIDFAKKDR